MSIRTGDSTTCSTACDGRHGPNELHNMHLAAPTLARRIIDLPDAAGHVFVGLVASHFATADTLTRATVERFVDEALAVSR